MNCGILVTTVLPHDSVISSHYGEPSHWPADELIRSDRWFWFPFALRLSAGTNPEILGDWFNKPVVGKVGSKDQQEPLSGF